MHSQTNDVSDATRVSCKTAVKVPFFILNIITWICGGALIGIGIWVVGTNNEYRNFVENKNIFIIYISLSAVLFTAGTFGACGVLVGNKFLLKIYFTLVCLVFCGLFGIVIFGIVEKNLVEKLIRNNWNSTNDDTRIFIQKKFDCCGIDNNVTYASDKDKSCFVNNNVTTMELKQNCYAKLVEWFDENHLTISLCGASVMFLMIFLMVATCWIHRQLSFSNRAMKPNRVSPADDDMPRGQDVHGNHHGSHSNHGVSANRILEQRHVHVQENELVSIEEPGEPSYVHSRRGKKEHFQRERSSNRQSWAKKSSTMR